MTSRSLGLVVVTYQSTDVLKAFLDSLKNSSVIPDSVVVVDNSPTAQTLPTTPWLKKIELIHRPDNPGYGTAANQGIKALGQKSDWVVVCNPDIVVQPDTLEKLLQKSSDLPKADLLAHPFGMKTGRSTPPLEKSPP